MTILIILLLTVSSVPACSLKVGNTASRADSKTAETENQNGESRAIIVKKTNAPSAGLTGTYRYKSGNYNNAISIEEQGKNRLRVSIVVNYEYKVDGEWMVNSGSAGDIVALKGDTVILVPSDFTDCQITLKFSANKIVVKQKGTESDCGFGANTQADGIYLKTSNELNANEMDDDALPLPDESKSERVNFKRGKSSATVSGKIAKAEEKVYLVGARSGQTMEVVITDGGKYNDVIFHIVAPDGSFPMGMAGELAETDSGWKGKLTKTGDYKIVVGVFEAEKTDFKMSVAIRSKRNKTTKNKIVFDVSTVSQESSFKPNKNY